MKLKWPQKDPQKQGRILEGGGDIFLAGPNIYPCYANLMELYCDSRLLWRELRSGWNIWCQSNKIIVNEIVNTCQLSIGKKLKYHFNLEIRNCQLLIIIDSKLTCPILQNSFHVCQLTLPFGPKPTKELSLSFVNCPYKLQGFGSRSGSACFCPARIRIRINLRIRIRAKR